MKIRLSFKVLMAATVPFALLVLSMPLITRATLEDNIKEGLRHSLRQSHQFAVLMRARHEMLNNRVLRVVAETPSLRACMDLVRTEGLRNGTAETLEAELKRLNHLLNFDLLLAADGEGHPLAGVLHDGSAGPDQPEMRSLTQKGLPTLPAAGFYTLKGKTYGLARFFIDQKDESLGSLVVGLEFDFSELSAPTILTRNGKGVMTNLRGGDLAAVNQALARCPAEGECDLVIRGETYLPVDTLQLGDGYTLQILESVDAASAPLKARMRSTFLIVAGVATIALLLMSFYSVKSIAGPITTLVARLNAAQHTGALPEVKLDTRVVELEQLAEAFNRAAQASQGTRDRLGRAYLGFIESMASAIDARDVYTAGHSRRVAEYAVSIAVELGMSWEDSNRIRIGAFLHDVGKIGVPDAILRKPGPLLPEEYAIIQEHPTIGKRILEALEDFRVYLPIVELHHENHDGSGYPHGLRADDIPLDARIVHVADAFDAMTSDRPYRKGMSNHEAIATLQQFSGTQFDPAIVAAFLATRHMQTTFASTLTNLAVYLGTTQNSIPIAKTEPNVVPREAGKT
ncbi:MAG: HD-GYP domain-containing protein [Candidatus Solibacter usitatus]|nr:HD-GYP domain-containing protein [Candidatus Solibacter usitatus]